MKSSAHLNLDQLILSPSQEWQPARSGWHFLRVTKGQAYWLDETAVLDLNEEDLLVLSPAKSGLLRASRLGSVQTHYFRFRADFVPGFLTLVERQYLERMALKPRLIPLKRTPDHPAARLFTQMLGEISHIGNLEQRSMLLQVVSLSFDWSARKNLSKPGEFLPATKKIKLILNELTETDLCDLSVHVLAERCACSVPHFNRLFRNMFGVSFRARQKEVRMNKSRQMITETNMAIEEVYQKVHFPSMRMFILEFKKEFGLTPAELRKQASLAMSLDGERFGS